MRPANDDVAYAPPAFPLPYVETKNELLRNCPNEDNTADDASVIWQASLTLMDASVNAPLRRTLRGLVTRRRLIKPNGDTDTSLKLRRRSTAPWDSFGG
jgi:hypothetical protein